MSATPIYFKDHTAAELHQLLAPVGVDLRLARRLQAAIVRYGGAAVPEALPEVPRRVLNQVREATVIPQLELIEKAISPTDGFAKYLFRGAGPEPFEAVRIPLLHRPHDLKYIVCVSSQVGCAMGCAFCATGRLGFRRNLATWEIVDQVMHIQADSPHPVRGVVFMGMGEPLLNYDRVMRAAEIFREPVGLAIEGKAISVSTVGIVPMMRRYTAERRPFRLVVSLTTADPERRRELLPVEQSYPLPELMEAVRAHQAVSGRRIVLAWTMLKGINTRAEDVRQLAELVEGLPVIIDLIEVNDATGQFAPPDFAEFKAFRDALSDAIGQPIVRRYSGGKDVHGACGMLAGREIRSAPVKLALPLAH